jgi:hypothetical protein
METLSFDSIYDVFSFSYVRECSCCADKLASLGIASRVGFSMGKTCFSLLFFVEQFFFFFVYNFWWNNPLKKIKIGGTMFPLLLGRILILINVPRLLLGLSNIVLRDFGSCFHVFLYLFFQF